MTIINSLQNPRSEGRRPPPRRATSPAAAADPDRRRAGDGPGDRRRPADSWKCSFARSFARAPTRGGCLPSWPTAARKCLRSAAGIREAGIRPSGGRRAGRGRNAAADAGRARAAGQSAGRRAGRRGEAGQRRRRAAQRRRGRRSALMVADAATDLYNPNAIRASLGTIFSVPVCEAAASECSRGCGMAASTISPRGWRLAVVHGGRLSRSGGHRAGQRGGGAYASSGRPTTCGRAAADARRGRQSERLGGRRRVVSTRPGVNAA